MIDLPDVNVWVAFSAPNHVGRRRAEEYWRAEAADHAVFNAITMLGFVRVCSRAPIFDGAVLSPAESWSIYLGWRARSEVTYLREPARCNLVLHRLLGKGIVSAATWTDAYLAAFAIAGGLRLVSFDGDFRRFPGLNFLYLGG